VDYAHSRGVIHCDLKPANVVVGKHGETLVVDWGLAKSVCRADPSVGEQTIAPSSSGSSETPPGSAVGTPACMSPEQLRGDLNRLGPRSDVYSWGATLYCLLTGKPPFEGEEVGAILNAVQEGHFPRPSRHDPALDKALEAVCLKAMATEPEYRYQRPRELAEDLDRWMADEPVTAWKEPLSRRCWRWARTHRTAVAGAVAALVAGVVGLSAVAAVQSKANADLRDANKRVEERYLLAVEAIKAFHTGVSEDFLLREGQFKELRDRLLKSAADSCGKLGSLLGKETDFASRR
jgi:serine/threonine-protein kinase